MGSSVSIIRHMIKVASNKLTVLAKILPQPLDFIVVGEMHGSRQNAPLIQELLLAVLTEQKPVTIAFEWLLTDLELDALRRYVHDGETPAQLSTFFLDSDGRFTLEHIALLKWIRAYNVTHNNLIDLYAFDKPSNSGASDQVMADSLRTYKKHHPESLILVETGNMHARNSIDISVNTGQVPMAAILRKDYLVFSIFLHYIRGKILVEGENRDVTKAASQQEGPRTYFDAVIEILVSESAQNPNDLTEILQLLKSRPA